MRLLFTIPDFWPFVRRGSERLVHDLGVVMARRGHDVTVLTRTPAPAAVTTREEGFTVEYHPVPRLAHRALGLNTLQEFALTAARKALTDPHDVHHAFYISDAYGLTLAARARPRPVVFSWHGVPDAAWWDANEPRTHRWYRRMMGRAARVSVMSERSAANYRRDYGRDPLVLTPGIFCDDFARPRVQGPPTIVCAAAIDDPRKRMDVLLKAFHEVASSDADVELVLAGRGDPAALRPLLDALPPRVRGRVHLDPETPLPETYARAAVGVLASEVEAFGLVVLEYLAAGLPVVVSDDGGSADLVTPETGAIFTRGDPADCARAIVEGLELSRNPATIGRCTGRARTYDWSARADAYEALYRSLV